VDGGEAAEEQLLRSNSWKTPNSCLEALIRAVEARLAAAPEWGWGAAAYQLAQLKGSMEADLEEPEVPDGGKRRGFRRGTPPLTSHPGKGWTNL